MSDARTPWRPVALRVGEARDAERGVFAAEPIPRGATIEECPVLRIDPRELPSLAATVLGQRFFPWGAARDEGALALGYGSFYQRSRWPNAIVRPDLAASTLRFVALRDIAEGEEITLHELDPCEPPAPEPR